MTVQKINKIIVYTASDKQPVLPGKLARVFPESEIIEVYIGNPDLDEEERLKNSGAHRVLVIDTRDRDGRDSLTAAAALSTIIEEEKPDMVVSEADESGRDVLGRYCTMNDLGIAADCTDIENKDGAAQFIRPAYDGKAYCRIETTTMPAVATFRPGVFQAGEVPAKECEIETEVIDDLPQSGVKILESAQEASEIIDSLDDAEIIVSGGRGLGRKEGFDLIRELADALGGAVGASKPTVEDGWIEKAHQVGVTGRKVKPKLYIACGISGAIQHTLGMKDSRMIIAVNTDPSAPIFKIANYGIVGDLYDVLPPLISKIREKRGLSAPGERNVSDKDYFTPGQNAEKAAVQRKKTETKIKTESAVNFDLSAMKKGTEEKEAAAEEEGMNFELDQAHQELRKLFSDFAKSEVAPIAREIDENERFPRENIPKMAANGMLGIPFPEKYGGTGLDNLAYAMCVEELSKVCGTTGVIVSAHTSLGSFPIYAFGTEEQKQKYLRPLASGEKLGAFGLTEPNAGTDASGQQTLAVKDGDDYILNGSKIFITNGGEADTYVIFTMTDPEKGNHGITAFIVDAGTPGFTIGKKLDKMGIRGSATSELIFKDCRVPAENMLGKEGEGFKIAMKTLDGGRIGIASQALGIAEGALEAAIEYTKQRKQFGRTISSYQNTQFQIANLIAKVEAARLLVYQAACAKDAGKPYSNLAAMAKLVASETARDVTTEAVQLFGGYGFTRDYPVERMMRDAKITEIYEGTSEVQRMVISAWAGVK